MFAPFLQKHAAKSPTLLRAVSWALWICKRYIEFKNGVLNSYAKL